MYTDDIQGYHKHPWIPKIPINTFTKNIHEYRNYPQISKMFTDTEIIYGYKNYPQMPKTFMNTENTLGNLSVRMKPEYQNSSVSPGQLIRPTGGRMSQRDQDRWNNLEPLCRRWWHRVHVVFLPDVTSFTFAAEDARGCEEQKWWCYEEQDSESGEYPDHLVWKIMRRSASRHM